jgi:methylated-DNA-protein-cysteine methyltransferase-like protein
LTGKNHFPGTDLMEQLLKNEGIFINNDQVMDFENYFWNPSKEL